MTTKIKRGVEFTGYIFLKCRDGHVTRTPVGCNFFNGPTKDHRTACSVCGRSLRTEFGKLLYGRIVEEIVCGGKCMGATGPSCDCSCGGMNHGASHGVVQ